MWDGREIVGRRRPSLQTWRTRPTTRRSGHAQAAQRLTAQETHAIVAFETALFTAQTATTPPASLRRRRRDGGPAALSHAAVLHRHQRSLGLNPTGAPFDRTSSRCSTPGRARRDGRRRDVQRARRAIARGQELFNTKPIAITGVGGLTTDVSRRHRARSVTGTCTTCHDTPNVGNHSVRRRSTSA